MWTQQEHNMYIFLISWAKPTFLFGTLIEAPNSMSNRTACSGTRCMWVRCLAHTLTLMKVNVMTEFWAHYLFAINRLCWGKNLRPTSIWRNHAAPCIGVLPNYSDATHEYRLWDAHAKEVTHVWLKYISRKVAWSKQHALSVGCESKHIYHTPGGEGCLGH